MYDAYIFESVLVHAIISVTLRYPAKTANTGCKALTTKALQPNKAKLTTIVRFAHPFTNAL
jgi:hypothetical protein